jgi:hypothetical protein
MEGRSYLCCGVCGRPFPDEDSLRDHTDERDEDGDQHDGESWSGVRTTVAAAWIPDCNGKANYDAQIVRLDTRYWPPWKSHNNRASAKATIYLEAGKVELDPIPKYGFQLDSKAVALAEKRFEEDTEGEVKAAVEAWALVQVERVWAAVIREFASDQSNGDWGDQEPEEGAP